MVRHIEKGIEVSEETLALDVIDGIGPKGIFIAEEHTVEHFRECWYPAIFDHTPVNSERKQGNIENKIQSRIDELLARPIPDELPAAARETIASLTHHWTL
jgi:trimethylamine--corrinoid protein Co-methyltransferase